MPTVTLGASGTYTSMTALAAYLAPLSLTEDVIVQVSNPVTDTASVSIGVTAANGFKVRFVPAAGFELLTISDRLFFVAGRATITHNGQYPASFSYSFSADTVVTGIQINLTRQYGMAVFTAGVFDGVIVREGAANINGGALWVNGAGTLRSIRRSLIIGSVRADADIQFLRSTVTGFMRAEYAAVNAVGSYFGSTVIGGGGGVTGTGSHNATGEASWTIAGLGATSGQVSVTSADFVNTGSGTEDYRRAPSSTKLGNTGTVIGGVTTDIFGTSLPQGAANDIGAHEMPEAGDTTAPTLSSPTGTGGTLAGSGTVSSANDANGTLYAVVTASATAPTAAQVKLGQDHTGAAALRVVSQAVSATGVQTIASGSITAGTRYFHYMHEDAAANQSAVVSSASFVVAASGAATAVTLTGPSSGVVSVASTSFTAGANGTITGTVTVTPSAGGGGGTFSPTSVAISSGTPTATFTYTPGTTGAKSISVTNNGSLSNPSAVTYTVSEAPAPGSGTLSLTGFAQWTGSPVVSVSVPFVKVCRISTGAVVLELTAQAISGAGAMSITNAALSPAVDYMVFGFNADGSASFKKKVTAS